MIRITYTRNNKVYDFAKFSTENKFFKGFIAYLKSTGAQDIQVHSDEEYKDRKSECAR